MKNGAEVFSEIPEIPAPGQEPTPPGEQVASGALPIGSCDDDITDLCGELVGIPFDAWETVSALPKSLTPSEQSKLGKRLARIMEKHPELKDKITDEILFTGSLIIAIGKRIKDERQHKRNNDSGKAGDGEKHAGKDACSGI